LIECKIENAFIQFIHFIKANLKKRELRMATDAIYKHNNVSRKRLYVFTYKRESSEELHLSEIERFHNIIYVFTVTFDHLNACFL